MWRRRFGSRPNSENPRASRPKRPRSGSTGITIATARLADPPYNKVMRHRIAQVLRGIIYTATILFGALVLGSALYPTPVTDRIDPGARCLSNVKQLGLGFSIYASDYDDRLP